MSGLCRLEAAGIPVVTLLAKNIAQFIKAYDIMLDERCLEVVDLESAEGVEVVMHQLGLMVRPRPLTWRLLFEVLRKLHLEDLSLQIEDCLTSESATGIVYSFHWQVANTVNQLIKLSFSY